MNLLFLLGKFPFIGGVESVSILLANEFISKGYKVFFASFEQPMPKLECSLDPGIGILHLSYPVNSNTNKQKLQSLIRENRIDFIINQWCLPYYVTLLCNKAVRGTDCQIIAVSHSIPNTSSKLVNVNNAIAARRASHIKRWVLSIKKQILIGATVINNQYVYRNSDRYILLSTSFIPIFKKFNLISKTDKLTVITNPNPIENLCTVNGSENKEKIILFVGRIDKQKRVDRIIKVWEKLCLDYQDWKLKIVGDGPEREVLEKETKKKGLPRISFEGFKNPLEYYKKSSLLLLTSDMEGFGLVVVEGMSFGVVPIVYGSYPSIHDIIVDKYSGYITEYPYNEEEMLEYSRKLMDDHELLHKMSIRSKNLTEKFSLKSVVSQWEGLFIQLKKNGNKSNKSKLFTIQK